MYTQALDHTDDLEHAVLATLAESWSTRVAVRRDRLDLSGYCDPALPDYPIAMVPFWSWRELEAVDLPQRMRLLGAAWIAYNEKTISIENDLVNPACNLLLRDELPGASNLQLKQVIAQMQVDEQFHVLMCLEICNSARQRHGLERLVVPRSRVVTRLDQLLAETRTGVDFALVRLAFATVAEMSINAFLRALATDQTIQPLNRLNTDLHRRDESAHAAIFRQIVRSVYLRLGARERDAFNRYLGQALHCFSEPDLSGWEAIFGHVNIAGADDILLRLGAHSIARSPARDYESLVRLLDELGNRGQLDFELPPAPNA